MNNKKQMRDKTKTFVTFFIIFIAISIAITVILILLNGKTTTSGQNLKTETSSSLVCISSDYNYPIIDRNNATKSEVKINAIFGNDKVSSISLILSLFYNTTKEISQGESDNHAKMNKSFHENSMEPDSLDATYTKLSDHLQISLYANASDLNGKTGKYFLLDNISNSITETQNNYKQKGFSCVIKE